MDDDRLAKIAENGKPGALRDRLLAMTEQKKPIVGMTESRAGSGKRWRWDSRGSPRNVSASPTSAICSNRWIIAGHFCSELSAAAAAELATLLPRGGTSSGIGEPRLCRP